MAMQCPRCGSEMVSHVGFIISVLFTGSKGELYACSECKHSWEVEKFEGVEELFESVKKEK